ncbi:trans-aconitate methyltransferase 1 [Rhodotorula kratochvilovae]
MATFAKRSFDAAAYAASRPSYPPALFQHILAYCDRAPPSSQDPRTLLDLGCGPGVSTFDWLPLGRFDRVVGVDPSEGMVAAARNILAQRREKGEVPEGVDVRFEVARADKLAGQAAHWFNAPATYAELARVLKPGGAFAFWGYGEFFFPGKPELSALIPSYSSGTLGAFWEQPGRSIVEALLTPFPLPSSSQSRAIPRSLSASFDPSSLSRSFFLRPGGGPPPLGLPSDLSPPLPTDEGSSASYSLPGLSLSLSRTVLLHRSWTLPQLRAYLSTWSAAHAFNRTHNPPSGGAEAERDPHGEESAHTDVVEVFIKQLQDAGLKLEEGETIEVAWEMGVVMGRKKAD